MAQDAGRPHRPPHVLRRRQTESGSGKVLKDSILRVSVSRKLYSKRSSGARTPSAKTTPFIWMKVLFSASLTPARFDSFLLSGLQFRPLHYTCPCYFRVCFPTAFNSDPNRFILLLALGINFITDFLCHFYHLIFV